MQKPEEPVVPAAAAAAAPCPSAFCKTEYDEEIALALKNKMLERQKAQAPYTEARPNTQKPNANTHTFPGLPGAAKKPPTEVEKSSSESVREDVNKGKKKD